MLWIQSPHLANRDEIRTKSLLGDRLGLVILSAYYVVSDMP